jgi:hypothetical protein
MFKNLSFALSFPGTWKGVGPCSFAMRELHQSYLISIDGVSPLKICNAELDAGDSHL